MKQYARIVSAMPPATDISQPTRDIVLMLALCPLLAASDTAVNALGLGIAVILATIIASTLQLALQRWLDDSIRLAATVLVLALIVALIERAMLAWFHQLHGSLGVFLPLIAVNTVLLRNWQDHDSIEGLANNIKAAVSIAIVLLLLGIARELVGRGSLFHDIDKMFGAWFSSLELVVFRVDMGFLLAMLPPGAFIAFGLLLALRNWIQQSGQETATSTKNT